MRRTLVGFILVVGGLAARAQAATPTYPDLTYAMVGTTPLKLDLYIPSTGTAPYPVVIYIHGGGWAAGSKSPIFGPPAQALAQGFAVAAIDYRLTSQAALFAPESVTFPAQIFDVKGAVRWLRAHAATYQLDSTRFASFGGSAGGHLSALLATSGRVAALEGDVGGNLGYSSTVQVAVDFLGPTDFLHMEDDVTTPPGAVVPHDDPSSTESILIGWDQPGQGIGDIKAHLTDPTAPYPYLVNLCNAANPITWVDAHDPPMFIVHGTDDTYVPNLQSTRLSAALFRAGVQHELRILPGLDHATVPQPVGAVAIEFVRDQLNGVARPDVGKPFCTGDGSAGACPCGNTTFGGANTGCKHSLGVGANLNAVGAASIANDTLVLRGNSMLDATVLYFQSAGGAATPFGDGLMCGANPVRRLGTKTNQYGYSQYPTAGDAPVSVQGTASAGATLYYQLWFRDSGQHCTNATFNLSNGLGVTWTP